MIISMVSPNYLTKEHCDIFKEKTGEEIKIVEELAVTSEILSEVEILISSGGGVTKSIVDSCKKLKWIFSISAGVDGLPFKELKEKNIIVSNTRGIHAPQIAEQTLGIMISFSRNLKMNFKSQLEKNWAHKLMPGELTGQTLCIIGAGSVGKEIARKAKAFDMNVIGLKNNTEPIENFDEVQNIKNLKAVLGISDYVVLIAPLTENTYKMIGIEEFKAMKKSAVFINMSRGDTVDEEAMIQALKEGYISGAGLDVFHKEPLQNNSPLWDMDNVIITPHNGGASPNTVNRATELLIKSYIAYKNGDEIPNIVDLKRKY